MRERMAFLSYTSRNELTEEVRQFMDAYLREMHARGIVFYDRGGESELEFRFGPRPWPEEGIYQWLGQSMCRTLFCSAFVAPEYFSSPWCRYEFAESERLGKESWEKSQFIRSFLPMDFGHHGPIAFVWDDRAKWGVYDHLPERRRNWVDISSFDWDAMRRAVDATLRIASTPLG